MISRQVSEIYMYYNVACGSSDLTNTDHVCLKNLQNFVPLLRCSGVVLFQISNAGRESQMKPPIALLSKNALS